MMFAMILWMSTQSGTGVTSVKENFSSMQLCQQALVSVDEKINRSRQVGAPYAGGICVQTSTGNQ